MTKGRAPILPLAITVFVVLTIIMALNHRIGVVAEEKTVQQMTPGPFLPVVMLDWRPSPTFTPMPTLTSTPLPLVGLMTGNVWLREGPSAASPRLGVILERGQSIEILAVSGDWYRLRWVAQAQAEARNHELNRGGG